MHLTLLVLRIDIIGFLLSQHTRTHVCPVLSNYVMFVFVVTVRKAMMAGRRAFLLNEVFELALYDLQMNVMQMA